MQRLIVPFCFSLWAILAASPVVARNMQLKADKVTMPVGVLEQVRLQVTWPSSQQNGVLQLSVGRLQAPEAGIDYRDVHWQCPVRYSEAQGWQCAGEVRVGKGKPMQLMVQLAPALLQATLQQGTAKLELKRPAASPDVVSVNLVQVPVLWAQTLLSTVWSEGHISAGQLQGQMQVASPANTPLQINAQLHLKDLGFESSDGYFAGANLSGYLQAHYSGSAQLNQLRLESTWHAGEVLAGNTYVALPSTETGLHLEATQMGKEGWQLPHIVWQDGDVLTAHAAAGFAENGVLQSLQVAAQSNNIQPLKTRYLSGWMGVFGLSDVELSGAMTFSATLAQGEFEAMQANLHQVAIEDPTERFVLTGLNGDLRYSASNAVESQLQWQEGKLYGLAFGQARLPWLSENGQLRAREAIEMPLLDGTLTFHDVLIRPPRGGQGMDIRFGMQLADIDFGKVAKTLELPAFQGLLSGDIPSAHYANDRIDFDGGLELGIFDGHVAFSSLALERPFGVAPSLSADIAMDDLDLTRLTEVLGFGSISGKLDGRITGLRLVDWSPVAFDARFITDAKKGVKQRISQRAVQDISSVGDASFFSSLQGQLIGLFSDFGYRQIGIGCHLENQVCTMSGLHSAGNAFTIVKGKGVPQLDVIGFNRAVDWPILLERLMAAGRGDVAPVIE